MFNYFFCTLPDELPLVLICVNLLGMHLLTYYKNIKYLSYSFTFDVYFSWRWNSEPADLCSALWGQHSTGSQPTAGLVRSQRVQGRLKGNAQRLDLGWCTQNTRVRTACRGAAHLTSVHCCQPAPPHWKNIPPHSCSPVKGSPVKYTHICGCFSGFLCVYCRHKFN